MGLIIQDNKLENLPSDERFDRLIEMAVANKSKTSKRVYGETYKRWIDYCKLKDIPRWKLCCDDIVQFIEGRNTTKTTRQRELAAMRRLLDILAIVLPNDQSVRIEQALLKDHKIKDDGQGEERQHQALSSKTVTRILEYWQGDSNRQKRNRAILALIFTTGLRSDELIKLKWKDINLEEGTLIVWHGKGDKFRMAAIYGDVAIDALYRWREVNTGIHVFPPITARGDNIRKDKPMCYRALWDIFEKTGDGIGETFNPHDARHTLLDEIIKATGDIKDAQAQAGHSHESTTLRYSHGRNAVERRKTKLRYG